MTNRGMHVVPSSETHHHETRHPCPCGPRTDIDEDETGQFGLVLVHQPLNQQEKTA